MEKINAKSFFESFQDVFKEYPEEAEAAYCNNKRFTSFIIRKINGFLSKTYGYKTQKEYFRIDAIGWTAKADAIIDTPGVSLNHHLWDLEVAVEHENDKKDWMDEVVKLAHIACPLRVVIGYIPWEKREYDQVYLDHVSKWLGNIQCRDNMQRGEFLIIFGNCNTEGERNRFYNYKGYLFDPKYFRFMPL